MDLFYSSTRGNDEGKTFTQALLQGLAGDGGLFVPTKVMPFSSEEIVEMSGSSYSDIAQRVFGMFGIDLSDDHIADAIGRAYGSDHFRHPRVAPVVDLGHGLHILELWHGPTGAFKDFALQIKPILFERALEQCGDTSDYNIVVATSGDTGGAALSGYAGKNISLTVLYPDEGVSDIQRHQMVSSEGENIRVYGVRGSFDDIQRNVKRLLSDRSYNADIHERFGGRLSSANSINWGRLMPQIVYYFHAYAQMVERGSIRSGDKINLAVPTGNFGNILAAFYARKMGLPIARFVCASNENNALTHFFETGTYDLRNRSVVRTPSPAIDILIPSNLERFLFEITRDPQKIRMWNEQLRSEQYFTIDPETQEVIGDLFFAGSVDNDMTLKIIRGVHDDHGYLLDPHTAVAMKVVRDFEAEHGKRSPVLIAATAHWSKFSADVFRALSHLSFSDDLPDFARDMTPFDLLRQVCALAREASVPSSISDLEDKSVRFGDVISPSYEALCNVISGDME